MSETTIIKKELLRGLADSTIKNTTGQTLGTVIQIPQTETGNEPGYLILKSTSLNGRGNRFFAIPATNQFIETNGIKASLKISKEDLLCAKAVNAAECPSTNISFENSTYELLRYEEINSLR